eukprot:scaffold10084_cov139-Isochrysis_galbana.AAC.8
MQKPRLAHYNAALAILFFLSLSYVLPLHHTTSTSGGLRYSGTCTDLEVFTDASWGRHPRDFCGHAILFRGARLNSIYSYTYAAKDLRFIQQLLRQFNGHGHDITLPTAILTDSSSAVPWIRNPGSTTRTRHYEKFLMCMAVTNSSTRYPCPFGSAARTNVLISSPSAKKNPSSSSSVLSCSIIPELSIPLHVLSHRESRLVTHPTIILLWRSV